jgi:hypothetical protein
MAVSIRLFFQGGNLVPGIIPIPFLHHISERTAAMKKFCPFLPLFEFCLTMATGSPAGTSVQAQPPQIQLSLGPSMSRGI